MCMETKVDYLTSQSEMIASISQQKMVASITDLLQHGSEETCSVMTVNYCSSILPHSGFLFLRFICPALLKPQLFDLITGT